MRPREHRLSPGRAHQGAGAVAQQPPGAEHEPGAGGGRGHGRGRGPEHHALPAPGRGPHHPAARPPQAGARVRQPPRADRALRARRRGARRLAVRAAGRARFRPPGHRAVPERGAAGGPGAVPAAAPGTAPVAQGRDALLREAGRLFGARYIGRKLLVLAVAALALFAALAHGPIASARPPPCRAWCSAWSRRRSRAISPRPPAAPATRSGRAMCWPCWIPARPSWSCCAPATWRCSTAARARRPWRAATAPPPPSPRRRRARPWPRSSSTGSRSSVPACARRSTACWSAAT